MSGEFVMGLSTRIERIISKGQLVPLEFGQANVAISQSDVQLVGNQTAGYIMPFAGEIVAVTYLLSANKTAGVMTVGPTVGGTEVASLRVTAANAAASGVLNVKRLTATFAKGAEIGAEITTDANFLPAASAELNVVVWVILSLEGI
jgi:hypothetical protein